GASLVLGRGPLAPMGALLLVVSMGLVLAAVGLAREAGLRITAPFVAVLLFANHLWGPRDLTNDLLNGRAENWGRVAVAGAVILGLRAIRSTRAARRSEAPAAGWRGDAGAAGVLFGVGAGTHLVPVVVGVAFVALVAAAAAVTQAGGVRVLRTAAMTVAVAALTGGVVLLAP